MKQKRFYPIILFLTSAAIFNLCCSSCKLENQDAKIDFSIDEINLWLDLMPGGPADFHFAGAVQIKNNSTEILKNLKIAEVVIKNDDVILYRIIPESDLTGKVNLDSNGDKKIKFYSPQNIRMEAVLNKVDSLNVILKFSSENKALSFDAGKFKLDRIY